MVVGFLGVGAWELPGMGAWQFGVPLAIEKCITALRWMVKDYAMLNYERTTMAVGRVRKSRDCSYPRWELPTGIPDGRSGDSWRYAYGGNCLE